MLDPNNKITKQVDLKWTEETSDSNVFTGDEAFNPGGSNYDFDDYYKHYDYDSKNIWNGTKTVTGLFATGQQIDVTPPLPARECGFLGPPFEGL